MAPAFVTRAELPNAGLAAYEAQMRRTNVLLTARLGYDRERLAVELAVTDKACNRTSEKHGQAYAFLWERRRDLQQGSAPRDANPKRACLSALGHELKGSSGANLVRFALNSDINQSHSNFADRRFNNWAMCDERLWPSMRPARSAYGRSDVGSA